MLFEAPEASVRQSLNELIKQDYVQLDRNKFYCVLDPAFRDFIARL
jgi:hypothetical protein